MYWIARAAVLVMMYFIFTKQQAVWLLSLPLAIALCCGIITLVYYLRIGDTKKAWIDLLKITVLMVVILIMESIQRH